MKWILILLLSIVGDYPIQEQLTNPYFVIAEVECDQGSNGNIQVKELKYNDEKMGYSIWMKKNWNRKVKMDYLAGSGNALSVYARYNKWKLNKKVLLCSSGGYTTKNNKYPIGLNIDRGVVINRSWNTKMDALVIASNEGINVLPIDQSVYFKPMRCSIKIQNDYDFSKFIRWAKDNKASVFQTHLLAYENQLTVSKLASINVAFRKLLVETTDDEGKEFLTLFYIRRGAFLFDAANSIVQYLQTKEYTVNTMINLDTGVNDILDLHPNWNTCNTAVIKGRTEINYAPNLIVFYQ